MAEESPLADTGVFVRDVNQMIDKGWQPQGGIGVSNAGQALQAMVKYE
jgi:hypothetical protein